MDHGHRHRAVQRDDGPRRDLFEHLVERQDLRPVRLLGARRLVVHGGDRRLELVRPDRPRSQGPTDECQALVDLAPVPELMSLFGERDGKAIRVRPSRPPGVGQQHECEETGDLPFEWHEPIEHSRQPDGLGGEVGADEGGTGARHIALVEDQVEHLEHDTKALRELVPRRQLEPAARAPDGLLRPADPLRHGGLGNQEGIGDLRRRQPPDRPQREGQLRRRRQGRMAAQEEQREGIVPVGRLPRASHLEGGGGLLTVVASALAPPSIDQPPVRHGREPRARALGDAVLTPLLGRGQQRLLHGILARVELSVPPHERPEDLRRELAQQVLDTRGRNHVANSSRASR